MEVNFFMEAMVQKWGNSLGIRIPNFIVQEFSLKNGSVVNINDNGNEIVIKPAKKNRLSEMLDKVNSQNLHQEIETTEPVGKEI
jgi:antitoxin MazE